MKRIEDMTPAELAQLANSPAPEQPSGPDNSFWGRQVAHAQDMGREMATIQHVAQTVANAKQQARTAKPRSQLVADALAAYNNDRPGMSMAEDVGRSATTGAIRGAASDTLGIIGNLRNLAGSYGDRMLNGILGTNDGKNWVPAVSSILNSTGSAGGMLAGAPSGQNFDPSIQAVTGPYHTPQTAAGRLAQTGAEMLPAALFPGSAAQRVAAVAGPALGSWGAGEVAPEPYKADARLAGGVLGGIVGGAVTGGSRPDATLVARKTPPMSPEMQAAVIDRMQTGQNIGLMPTTTESIDATVPGARSALLQQSVEGTPRGVEVLGPRMAARPAQMQAVMADILNKVAPKYRSPDIAAQDAQGAALEAIRGAEAQRSAATRPLYQAAEANSIPPADVQGIIDDIAARSAADRTGAIAGPLDKFQKMITNPDGTPVTDIGNLHLAQRVMRDSLDLPPGSADSIGRTQAGIVGPYVQRLADLLTQDPDLLGGNRVHGVMTKTVVDPMTNGAVGDIAGNGVSRMSATQMGGRLLPNAPAPGATADNVAAVNALGPPAADILRARIGQQVSESAQDIAGKPNTFAPSNFSTKMAGNPLQRENLLAVTNAASPGSGDAMARALDTFDTTGRRMGEGSNTITKGSTDAEIASGARVINAGIGGGSLRLILDRLTGWADNLKADWHQKDLVDFINANPDQAAELLRKVEAARGNTALQRAIIGGAKAGAMQSGTPNQ